NPLSSNVPDASPALPSSAPPSPSVAPAIQADSSRYENEAIGIRFTMPTDFVWDETQPQPNLMGITATKTLELWQQEKFKAIQAGAYAHGTELPPNVRIAIYPNLDRLSVKDWVDRYSEQYVQPRDFQTRSIAGQTGLSFRSTGLYELETVVLPNLSGDEVIAISLATVGVANVDEPNQRAFAQVVSSFELMEQANAVTGS
ncbi:MAG TPA: hypothetical protein V6C65_37925, partial [Allocoleopsis sp.]